MGAIEAIGGVVQSLVGAGANLIAANKQNHLSQWMQQKQFDHADAAATTAYMRQRELINDMNVYNDPSNVKQRLEAAGFNPYLAVNNGGATVSAASANVQQANTPSASYVPNYYQGLGESLSQGINIAIQNMMAMKRLENETKVADAQAENLKAQAGQTGLQTEFDRKTFDVRVLAEGWKKDLIANQSTKEMRDAMLKQVQAELVAYQKDNLKASTEEIEAQKEYLVTKNASQLILNRFLPDKEAQGIALLLAQTRKAYIEGDLSEVYKGLVKFDAETRRIEAEASKKHSDTYDWSSRNISPRDWLNAGSGLLNHVVDGVVPFAGKGGFKKAKPIGFNPKTGARGEVSPVIGFRQ